MPNQRWEQKGFTCLKAAFFVQNCRSRNKIVGPYPTAQKPSPRTRKLNPVHNYFTPAALLV